jgi:hypothetical protein
MMMMSVVSVIPDQDINPRATSAGRVFSLDPSQRTPVMLFWGQFFPN